MVADKVAKRLGISDVDTTVASYGTEGVRPMRSYQVRLQEQRAIERLWLLHCGGRESRHANSCKKCAALAAVEREFLLRRMGRPGA